MFKLKKTMYFLEISSYLNKIVTLFSKIDKNTS